MGAYVVPSGARGTGLVSASPVKIVHYRARGCRLPHAWPNSKVLHLTGDLRESNLDSVGPALPGQSAAQADDQGLHLVDDRFQIVGNVLFDRRVVPGVVVVD